MWAARRDETGALSGGGWPAGVGEREGVSDEGAAKNCVLRYLVVSKSDRVSNRETSCLTINWGGWTRTINFPINSRTVCQLTYAPSLAPHLANKTARRFSGGPRFHSTTTR